MADGTTVIGSGIRIEGKITGPAPIEVQGELEGTAGTEALFTVRPKGKVQGEVAAREVVIEGKLDGSVDAEEKVKLCASSQVKGELSAKKVSIDEGAFFDGIVHMRGKGGR